MASLDQIVAYADKSLRIPEIDDWDNALNGLQIANSGKITKIGAAVDVSTRVLREASGKDVDLLLVHHGLFWPGLRPVTNSLHRQLKLAFENDIALYSAHLPLDVHPVFGNNAQLASALGIKSTKPFLEGKGQLIGVKARSSQPRAELLRNLRKVLAAPIKAFNFPGRCGQDRHVRDRRSAPLGGGRGRRAWNQSCSGRPLRHRDVWCESIRGAFSETFPNSVDVYRLPDRALNFESGDRQDKIDIQFVA
jgi:putative NIF3 family GTP cyclohydrolase 1 type 2